MEDGELWVRDGTDSGEAKEMGGVQSATDLEWYWRKDVQEREVKEGEDGKRGT